MHRFWFVALSVLNFQVIDRQLVNASRVMWTGIITLDFNSIVFRAFNKVLISAYDTLLFRLSIRNFFLTLTFHA